MATSTQLCTEDLFDGLSSEDEGELKRFDLQRDSTLEKIVKKFKRIWDKEWTGVAYKETYEERVYRDSCKLLSTGLKKGVSTHDVEQFVAMLGQYDFKCSDDGSKVGIFLSALVNNSTDESFNIPMAHLVGRIPTEFVENSFRYMGYRNTKNVTISGDVQDVAQYMENGNIIVKGNVTQGAGRDMQGGRVEIEGDLGLQNKQWSKQGFSGSNSIRGMHGGEIHVNGNVYGEISVIFGGEIHLNGDYDEIALDRYCRGWDYKIFHKGKLIVENGRDVGGGKIRWY